MGIYLRGAKKIQILKIFITYSKKKLVLETAKITVDY